jgi:hypothetical protein
MSEHASRPGGHLPLDYETTEASREAAFRRWRARDFPSEWSTVITDQDRREIEAIAHNWLSPAVTPMHLARAVLALLNQPSPAPVLPPLRATEEMIREGVDELGESVTSPRRRAVVVEAIWERMLAAVPANGSDQMREALGFRAAFIAATGKVPTVDLFFKESDLRVEAVRRAKALLDMLETAEVARDTAINAARSALRQVEEWKPSAAEVKAFGQAAAAPGEPALPQAEDLSPEDVEKIEQLLPALVADIAERVEQGVIAPSSPVVKTFAPSHFDGEAV